MAIPGATPQRAAAADGSHRALAVAARVDTDRLWQRHLSMARHGATPSGGVNRQALSDEDLAAQRALIAWGEDLGLRAAHDDAGNLFLRRDGANADAAPVLTGSHMDSQPTGGRFDGIYGVLAGLEALQALHEAGVQTRRPIELVAWMNEEGSRFAPGMMGSAAFGGAMTLDKLRRVTDAQGCSVGEALDRLHASFAALPRLPLRRPVHAYIEAHIEQGPLLEIAGKQVGIVTGIQGKRTFRVTLRGEEAHAGTSPHAMRRDALQAAVRAIHALSAAFDDPQDRVRFTVGRLDVSPNAPSVVPALVSFSIDLRHPDSAVLQRLGDQVAPLCRAQAAPCEVTIDELSSAMSLEFPAAIRATIARAAACLGVPAMELPSAAGHDARYLHPICPSGMIFVPSRDGISHNEAEWSAPEDLALGARVLALTLLELAGVAV